ncbi:MAG: hypothetical protein HOE95_10285 [Flavobacteriales bacterium]|nr:hypothetical protein [Flavobacteriales bacterium]
MVKALFIALCTVLGSAALAQDTVQHIAYGTPGTEIGVRAIPTESNLYLFGSTGGVGAGQSDIYIIKLDTAFEPMEFVPIGNHGIETLRCVEYDSMSNLFVLAAVVYDGFSASDYDVQLYVVDENLELIRTKRLNNFGNDDAISLSLDSNEISLFIERQIEDDLYKHSRFDLELNLIDDFELQMDSFHLADHIIKDSELHILGDGIPADSSERNIVHMKIDASGEILSQANFGWTNSEIASHMMIMSDSTWLFTGSTNSLDSEGDYDAYLAKVNNADSIIWQVSMGHSTTVTNQDDYGVESFEHSDGTIYIGMSTRTFGKPVDFHLYNYSSGGNFINGTSFGLERDEHLTSSAFLADSSYIMFGTTESFGAGQEDFILVHTTSVKKTTSLGYSEIEDDQNASNQAAGTQTNKFNNLTVKNELDEWVIAQSRKFSGSMTLYNLLGQEVWRREVFSEGVTRIPKFQSPVILELYDSRSNAYKRIKLVK